MEKRTPVWGYMLLSSPSNDQFTIQYSLFRSPCNNNEANWIKILVPIIFFKFLIVLANFHKEISLKLPSPKFLKSNTSQVEKKTFIQEEVIKF